MKEQFKKLIEEKLEKHTEEHKKAISEIQNWTAIAQQLQGAIAGLQDLLKSIED